MMLLGLTGGIATGKSTVRQLLAERIDCVVFDADACVHDLLSSDDEIRTAIAREFGLPRPVQDQPLDRSALRQLVFTDPEKRHRLEAILHPAVRLRWQSLLRECRERNVSFLADIPLLFETGGHAFFDTTLLVVASAETQRVRLAGRGIQPELVEAMLASQWPFGQKIALAQHVIWNDGSLAALRQQVSLLLEILTRRAV